MESYHWLMEKYAFDAGMALQCRRTPTRCQAPWRYSQSACARHGRRHCLLPTRAALLGPRRCSTASIKQGIPRCPRLSTAGCQLVPIGWAASSSCPRHIASKAEIQGDEHVLGRFTRRERHGLPSTRDVGHQAPVPLLVRGILSCAAPGGLMTSWRRT